MNTEITPLHAVSNPVGIGEVNLANQNQDDYTIHANGDIVTTQRVAAKLCGVAQQAIHGFCLSSNYDVNHGLTPEIVYLLVKHYAIDSKAANDTHGF